MSSDLYHNKYRIPSARATWHDYNGGAYFVTICTRDMEHYFGEIVSGEMNMTEIGEYADEQLRNVSAHYPYAEIPLWVVMPNHIHAIMMIDGDKTPHEKRNTACLVETFHETSLQPQPIKIATQMQSWLSVIVRQFKQSVTRYANANSISFAWQTRFHDRIIRDCDEMNRIAEYIENNVARWESDEFHNSNQNDSKAKAE